MIKRLGIFHILDRQPVEPKAICWDLYIKRLVVCESGGLCGGSCGPGLPVADITSAQFTG